MIRRTARARIQIFFILTVSFLAGCAAQPVTHHGERIHGGDSVTPEAEAKRVPLKLTPSAQEAHKAIMHEHLEAVHGFVAALAANNYEEAAATAERQLGFAKHREAMRRQDPESFPPPYHDLAMAHHQAAEQLAVVTPSGDLTLIVGELKNTLRACVACHRRYEIAHD